MPFEAAVGIGGFVLLLSLIMLGVPVFISMLVVSITGFWMIGGLNFTLTQLSSAPIDSAQSYLFAVVPLFMLMGELAAVTGLGEDTFTALNKWVGKLRGGLLMSTIGANAVFGAVSANPITVTILSIRVALPQLLKHKYDKRFCLAAIVTAGVLDALVPPSTPIVIFCILTGVSVGRALVAGILPGIALTVLFCIGIWIYAKIYPHKVPVADIKVAWRERFTSLTPLWPVLLLFMVIIGGIYMGVFPPTVGGAIGASATLIYALARRTSMRKIIGVFRDVCLLNCTVFPMLIAGFIFARFTALTGLADYLLDFVVGLQAPPLVVMAAVVIIYILISFPMDLMPAMIITLPIFFPLLTGIGFNPYLIVVVLVLLMTVANLTPPTGNALYITASLAEVNVTEIWRAVTPWFIMVFIFVWIVILFPPLSTWLPDLLYK